VKIWIDAQLSPALAPWPSSTFGVETCAVRELGLRDATDREIFFGARAAQATIMSKDRDCADLVQQHGPPPTIIWITCGNTSNDHLKQVLAKTLPAAMELMTRGEHLVEIGDPRQVP